MRSSQAFLAAVAASASEHEAENRQLRFHFGKSSPATSMTVPAPGRCTSEVLLLDGRRAMLNANVRLTICSMPSSAHIS